VRGKLIALITRGLDKNIELIRIKHGMEYLEKRSGNCKCPGEGFTPGHFFYNRQEPLYGSFFLHEYERLAPVLIWSAELE